MTMPILDVFVNLTKIQKNVLHKVPAQDSFMERRE
jgi:hypothetical protein